MINSYLSAGQQFVASAAY